MKILVLIHEFPPIGGGGGPIARDLSREWVKQGHQVRVVTARYGKAPKFEVWEGVEIVRLNSCRKKSFQASLAAMLGYVISASWYCLTGCGNFHPDLIHVHFAVPGGAAALAASRILKVPYVITAHLGDIPGASPEKTKNWFRVIFPMTPPIWNHAARVIAVSQYSRGMALKSYHVPIDVIRNGIDVQTVRMQDLEKHPLTEIVYAGRFVPQKNLIQIVSTLSQLKDLPWHCSLIGDGEQKQMLQDAIQNEGMEERFSFSGWLSPEEVIGQFRKSDILFLPSLTEGLPVVGIQAMASGLALLLSNCGGNTEIVQPGMNGFMDDPQDTEGFAHDLRSLLSDPELLFSMRQKSLLFVENFDMRNTAQQYLRVFEEVLSQKDQ